jgi:ribulose-phosphate 3-epimerase
VQTTAHELIADGPSLSAGILAADLLHLGDALEELESTGFPIVHFDVMDGVFCPPLSFGAGLLAAVPDRFVRDVHLMVDEPLAKAHEYVAAGADLLTFQVEATRHPHRVLQSLRGSSVVRGVALSPGTPVQIIGPLLDELELVLILAVNPGWSGQSFLSGTEQRISDARSMVRDAGKEIVIAVDGGITAANVEYVASLGVDVIVAGSAVFEQSAATSGLRLLEAVDRAKSKANV